MTETHEAPQVSPTRIESETEDLSQAIRQSVERGSGEEVRCVRVYKDRYRCNWWVKDDRDGANSVSGRIIRSRFLKATQTPDGLLIEDLTR